MSDKPKCPVFGCTIPRGIPHEHPAGVSAVMRDPAEPLNAAERGELMHYRLQEEVRRMRAEAAASNGVHVIIGDVKIHAGRRLRDALLQAGALHGESSADGRDHFSWDDMKPDLSGRHDRHGILMVTPKDEGPSRSFVKSVGRIAFWMIVAVAGLAFAALALYVRFNELAGWWS